MKKMYSSLRTRIGDISTVGEQLTDAHLRFAAGGGGVTYPASITEPGKSDPARDYPK